MIAFDMGEGDKKAQLIVTRFNQNSTGSFLDNVNRWRNQIGLPPVADTRTWRWPTLSRAKSGR